MALSTRSMRPGALRHVATLEQPPTSGDGAGGVTGSWTTVTANIAVAIEPLGGSERFQAAQTQFRTTHRVTMLRNPSSVPTTAMRWNFGGRYLYIVNVLSPDEVGVWLEMACEERAA